MDVLLRLDHSLPEAGGAVLSYERLYSTVPTVEALLASDCNVTVISHFGNPTTPGAAKSMSRIAIVLRDRLIGARSYSFEATLSSAIQRRRTWSTTRNVQYVENLRSFEGERTADDSFAASLSQLGDIYVNDGFSVTHRNHASTRVLPGLLRSYRGPALEAEIGRLDAFLRTCGKKVLIVGGAKCSQKLGAAIGLANQFEEILLVGLPGVLADPTNLPINSEYKMDCPAAEAVRLIGVLREEARRHGCSIWHPRRYVVQTQNGVQTRSAGDVLPGDQILDIGPSDVAFIDSAVRNSDAALWIGPLGRYERVHGLTASAAIARRFDELSQMGGARVLAGGGDTSAAVEAALGTTREWVSLSGGATLEYLANRGLHNLEQLRPWAELSSHAI